MDEIKGLPSGNKCVFIHMPCSNNCMSSSTGRSRRNCVCSQSGDLGPGKIHRMSRFCDKHLFKDEIPESSSQIKACGTHLSWISRFAIEQDNTSDE